MVNLTPATTFHWWQPLFTGPAGGYALAGLASLLGLVVVVGLYVRVHRRLYPARQTRPEADGQAGVATIEFALVFPIILFLVLLLLQTTLVMVGNVFVHYSAFAATRAAVVEIPADREDAGEPSNSIRPEEGGAKFDRIEEAAIFALMPVSGQLKRSRLDAAELPDALHEMYAGQGRQAPNWVDRLSEERLHYAATKTDSTLMRTRVKGDTVSFEKLTGRGLESFSPREPITVRVDHQLNLSVPYVRGIFSDGKQDLAEGEGAYTDLSAQYTLTNEGIDTQLPPRPDLPREE